MSADEQGFVRQPDVPESKVAVRVAAKIEAALSLPGALAFGWLVVVHGDTPNTVSALCDIGTADPRALEVLAQLLERLAADVKAKAQAEAPRVQLLS